MSGFAHWLKWKAAYGAAGHARDHAAIGVRSVISARSSLSIAGDSKMAYGYSTGAGGGTQSVSHIGWFNDLMAQSGVGLDIIHSAATGGSTLGDLLNTQLPLSIASGAEGLWIHSGVNNFSTSGSNSTIAASLGVVAQILAAASPAFKYVIVDSIDPVLQSGSTGAKGRAFQFRAYNAAVEALCNQYTNVIFNNLYPSLVDSANVNNDALANTVRADDGIHYVSNGGRIAGCASFANVAPRLKITKYRNVNNIALPTFSGTGGTVTPGTFITVTGTPPVGWELLGVSGAAANQTVTFSTLAPDMIRTTWTNNGIAGVTYLRVLVDATHNASLLPLISNGSIIQGSFGFQASGITNVERIACTTRINGSGTYVWNGMGQTTNEGAAPVYPTIAHGGIRSQPPYTVPVAVTSYEFIIAVKMGATSSALTLDLYAPKLATLT